MIKKLEIKNFTVFENTTLDFTKGINVIIGPNGTGKTHILKIVYTFFETIKGLKNNAFEDYNNYNYISFTTQLIDVFSTNKDLPISKLSRFNNGNFSKLSGTFMRHKDDKIEYEIVFNDGLDSLSYDEDLDVLDIKNCIFIPTKELLSMFKGLRGLYADGQISLDKTYPDLCDRLDKQFSKSALNGPFTTIIEFLSDTIGATIQKTDDGRFSLKYKGFNNEDSYDLEIDLVAEGHRKIATLMYLLSNGSIKAGTTVCWDEPEANMNPLLLEKLAKAIVDASKLGVQFVIATHSLFLMKELQNGCIVQNYNDLLFTSLSIHEQSGVFAEQAKSLLELETIASLDAESEQIDRLKF